MSWSLDLETCSWRGVELQVQQITDSQRRKRAQYEYPYRDGAEHEDMGREARPTSFTAVFWGPAYLNALGVLQSEVDTGEAGTFTHPLLGAWNAHVDISSIEHAHDQREMATVQLEVIETGLDAEIEPTLSLGSLDAKITVQIADLEETYEDLPQTSGWEKVYDGVTDLVDRANAIQDAVDDSMATIDQRLAEARQSARNLISTVKKVHPANLARGVTKRAQYLAESCRQIAKVFKSDKPQIRQHQQQVEGSLHQVVADKTGNVDNYDEVIALNKIRNPNRIKAGDTVAVFEGDDA